MILVAITAVLPACHHSAPSPQRGLPKAFVTAYEEVYGHCYDSIPYSVVALDLYSEGLELDKNHRIKGTGYNLYLSDIFVPDSMLETGMYKSIPRDSLAAKGFQPSPFTFLPGLDFEGYPHGMYLLSIEEDKMTNIQLLDSGYFAYRNDSLYFTLYYRNSYGSRATYNCYCSGPLIPWQKK